MPKTNAERQKALRDRRRKNKLVQVWMTREQRDKFRRDNDKKTNS